MSEAIQICKKCGMIKSKAGWQTPPMCFNPRPDMPKLWRNCPTCQPVGVQAILLHTPLPTGDLAVACIVKHGAECLLAPAEMDTVKDLNALVAAANTKVKQSVRSDLYPMFASNGIRINSIITQLKFGEQSEQKLAMLDQVLQLLTPYLAAGNWITE